MGNVLVTGGTGMLGRRLVPLLVQRGHDVRLLSRHPSNDAALTDAEAFQGNVRTGEGLDLALRDVDTVVHAATSPFRRVRATEVDGTRNVLSSIDGRDVHLIYVSIVGVDRMRLPYYKAKWAAEQLVESSSAAWTIQRATQFHDLVDGFLKGLVFIRTPNLSFQVVDPDDVSARLADLVEAGPSGRAPDFGGPEVLNIRQLAEARRETKGRTARLLPLPRLGPLRDLDQGSNLCPNHRSGQVTWQEWLAANRE